MLHVAMARAMYDALDTLTGDLAAFARRQDAIKYEREDDTALWCFSYGDDRISVTLVDGDVDDLLSWSLQLSEGKVLLHTIILSDMSGVRGAVLSLDGWELCATFLADMCEDKHEGTMTLARREPWRPWEYEDEDAVWHAIPNN